jgi:hypothetical protein
VTSPESPPPSPTPPRPVWRKLAPAAQLLAVVAGLAGLYGVVRVAIPVLRVARPVIHWGTLALASAVWLASYAQLVELWASSLPWWDGAVRGTPARLSFLQALRVFFVSNLARYVPGAVWQFAGLAALTAAAGASPVAASVGVLMQQLVLLATGFALVLSGAPHVLGAWTQELDTLSQAALAVILTAALIVVGPHALPAARRLAERFIKRPVPLPTPPPGAFALYVIRSALGWVAYGTAFWLFGISLYGSDAPHFWLAATSYLTSYLLGLLAVFAPAGLVVREGAIVLALSPTIGAERALVLAVASRLWLVAVEICGALTVVAVDWVSRRLRASEERK